MKLSVDVKVSRWAWGDGDDSHVLVGGKHDLETDNELYVSAIGAAHAADPGSIEVVDADKAAEKIIAGACEPDSESLKVLAKAIADGSWAEGNLEAAVAAEKGKFEAALEAGDEDAAKAADFRMAQAADALLALRGEA